MRKFLLGALLVFTISGCKAGQGPDMTLHGIWVAESIRANRVETGPSKRPELGLHVDEMRMSGSDGCNRITGQLKELDEKRLRFGAMASTRRACPDMKTSDEFARALTEVRGYKREGPKLILLDAGGREVLKFKKTD